jgi:uridine phosphorylase
MRGITFIVPRGAEAAAVRHAAARIIIVPAGAASARALPPIASDELVVVTGLCGALDDVRVGTVVVYDEVSDATGKRYACDASIAAKLSGAQCVAAYTADHVVTEIAERRDLAARSGARVVDCEGTHLAAELAARGVRVTMVRVVSDDARRDLPDIADAIDEEGRVRPLRLAIAFARKPRAALAFIGDVRRALRELTRVARVLTATE